jgi:AcrR family transcriptional regulator
VTEAVHRERMPAAERRRALLETACEVFCESSYRGATTAEIARRCGVSEPILYRHFGSKRDLYLACLDEAWQRLRAVGEDAAGGDRGPTACFGEVVRTYMRAEERVRLVDLWIQALTEAKDDPTIAAAVGAQIREVHDWIAEQIRAGQAEGELIAERDAVAEAWLVIAGGLLATIDGRLGGFLRADMERVSSARRAWMTGRNG